MTSGGTGLDLVTGAFSYSGARIAERLIESGREVRTLTLHPDRGHPLQARVRAFPYRFDDPVALTRSLEGINTLYNTYWVRFDRGHTTFAGAVANSRVLFHAAQRAGVARIVHVSIANPSIESMLPYYRGKPVPGSGRYPVQPVHVDDLAQLCEQVADADGNLTVDAAGPETMSYEELVQAIRRAIGTRAPILHLPPLAIAAASRALGLLVRDVILTPDEISGLTGGLLVSHQPPRGRIGFTEWLDEHRQSLGRSYANEIRRHFSP
jgi:NADH dehydrogenase